MGQREIAARAMLAAEQETAAMREAIRKQDMRATAAAMRAAMEDALSLPDIKLRMYARISALFLSQCLAEMRLEGEECSPTS